MKRKTAQFLIILLLVIIDFSILQVSARESKVLKAHFLDVGQGDSILFETPTGQRILIDTGKPGTASSQLSRYIPFYDREIDMLVLTHSDMDHVGDAVSLLERYKIKNLLISDSYADEAIEREIIKAAKVNESQIIIAKRGRQFNFGNLAMLVLFPDRIADELESNTASVGLKISYGESDFILTGDMPSAVEDYITLLDGSLLETEILKLGHHGSKTSSSDKFLAVTSPEYVVISAGEGNSYGHPHEEVLEKLRGTQIIDMTKSDETVTFVTDGSRIELID